MATIAQTWNNATPAGGDSISAGDDRIRELKAAIQERAQNAGVYWPDTSAAQASGSQFISPLGQVADHWIIYGASAGAPDLTKRLFDLTGTTLDVHSAVTANYAGGLQLAGSSVIAKSGTKRTLVLTASGLAAPAGASVPEGDRRIHLNECFMYVPQLNQPGLGAVTGHIREFGVMFVRTAPVTNPATFDLQQAVSGVTWSSDAFTALSTTSLLSAVLSVPAAPATLGKRVDDAAGFLGGIFPPVAGGDVLVATGVTVSNANNNGCTAFVVIDLDWP